MGTACYARKLHPRGRRFTSFSHYTRDSTPTHTHVTVQETNITQTSPKMSLFPLSLVENIQNKISLKKIIIIIRESEAAQMFFY